MVGFNNHRGYPIKEALTYQTLDAMLQGRNKQSRKLANNTYALRTADILHIRLHDTDIITYYKNGDIALNSGGWRTPTTKDRLNAYLPFRISQDKGVWYLLLDSQEYVFADNMTVKSNGKVTGAGKSNPKADKAFKAKVKKYAQLCANAVPLDKPGAGDCWYCCMTISEGTDKGKPLGEAIEQNKRITRSDDHITHHMTEGYIVPSLVARALELHYNAPMAFWEAFKDTGWKSEDRSFGKRAVSKAVYKYILRQFGYAI